MSAVQQQPTRVTGIDSARGLAILLMVFSHTLHWLYTGTSHDLIKFFGSLSLGDLATPVFYTVSGFSLYLSITAHLRKGTRPFHLLHSYRARFTKLFLVGLCLSLIWGVLQAQALALTIIAACFLTCFTRCGGERSRQLVLGVAIASLLVHRIAVNFVHDLPLSFVLRGQFPFFAVLGMVGLGFFATVILRSEQRRNIYLCLTGGMLIALSQILHAQGVLLQRSDLSPSFIFLGLGLALLLIGIFNHAVVRGFFIARYLAYVGRDALFLFVFHYAALFLPVYLLGLSNHLGAAASLSTAALFAAIIIFTAVRRRSSSFTIYLLVDKIFDTGIKLGRQAAFYAGHIWSAAASMRVHAAKKVEQG